MLQDDKICVVCGVKYRVPNDRSKRQREIQKCCSTNCVGEFLSSKNVGECLVCGKNYKFESWRKRKYCSKGCSYIGRLNRINKVCVMCGQEYESTFGRRYTSKFCSVKCRILGMQGETHGSYKGGKVIRAHPGGMQYWALRGIRSKHGGEMFEHRHIAECALGRQLKTKEVVHHINCDSLDNRNENLLICDANYHAWLHQEMARRYAQEKFGKVISIAGR